MNEIENAIRTSHKLSVTLRDGKTITVHPYFILKNSTNNGRRVLRGFVEGQNEISCDVVLADIKSAIVLPQQYAIDHSCLHFNFRDYEIVFPKKNDLINV